MFENFDFYKAKQFLLKTNQCEWIIQGVTGLSPYYETDILDIIENIIPCNYYMIEKLYCLIMKELDYDVPFTLLELIHCIKYYPKRNIRDSINPPMIMLRHYIKDYYTYIRSKHPQGWSIF